ncbi:hypothetical protein B0J13DRAFT_569481 [Dactylonectria estremocensis]|uniref:Lysine-specific metallo-endopeptidase domain-containing protein n=1 Tax=Dactylonectria estremocensis TaxID=1079267 RepID=A0A9P9DGB3_9HYPO|nr:hypothetical protein B0J13DRAFT_569481 [Dactylonectria estremocensis]
MVYLRHVWLMAGLMPGFGAAATANLNIWDVDASCDAYGSYLQDCFNEALEMAIAARDSLNLAMLKRPDKDAYPAEAKNWNRVAFAMEAALGFLPSKSREESQSDAQSGQYWTDSISIYSKIADTLQADVNDPAKGFSSLANRDGAKPKIICGEEDGVAFTWLNPSDTIPGKTTKVEDNKDFKQLIDFEAMEGAWFNDGRWFFKQEVKQTPILCMESGLRAAVYFSYDLVHFCDKMFADDRRALPTPTQLKNGAAKAGDDIDALARHMSFVLLHEMTHWFGGLNKRSNGGWNYGSAIIDDITAVNAQGQLQSQGGKRVKSYGKKYVWNLAMKQTRDNRANAANFGPAKALKNADSLAYFAFMAYVDNFDFARKGYASAIP